MRKFLLICAGAVALSGCTPFLSALTSTPATYSQATVLDEKAAITAELAYKAARLATETAVDAGLIKGQRATDVAALDNRAFEAVLSVRAAYRAGNAQSYASAASDANIAIAGLLAAIKGGQ